MKNATTYTAMINANDGIHVFRASIADHDTQYESFEVFANGKADELNGELFEPYCDDDIAETVDVDITTEVNPDNLYATGEDDPADDAALDAEIESIRKEILG